MDDAIEDLHIELDRITEQVRFYTDITHLENNGNNPITTRFETFRIVMDELATALKRLLTVPILSIVIAKTKGLLWTPIETGFSCWLCRI